MKIDRVVSATFYCHLCGNVASTVHYVPAGVRDPRWEAEPNEVPPGVGGINQQSAGISIAGGPISVTISAAGDWDEAAIEALRSEDPKELMRIDREFAPFWCIRCEKSYCSDHWRTRTRFDDGFFDYIEGFCPENHRQMLMD